MALRFVRAAIWSGVLTLAAGSTALGQTCAGGMSMNLAPWQMHGAGGWSGAGPSAAVSIAAGTDRLFGSLSSEVLFASNDRAAMPQIGVVVGTDQPVTLDNTVHVCPMLTAIYARRTSRSAAGAGGHIAIGWIARNRTALAIVPSAAAGVRYRPRAAPDAVLQRGAEIEAAIGLVVNGRIAFTPRLQLSHAGRGFSRSATIEVAVDVGHR